MRVALRTRRIPTKKKSSPPVGGPAAFFANGCEAPAARHSPAAPARHSPRHLPSIEASSRRACTREFELKGISFQFKFPGGGMSDIQRGLGELC